LAEPALWTISSMASYQMPGKTFRYNERTGNMFVKRVMNCLISHYNSNF
jgi:hypothetical protein